MTETHPKTTLVRSGEDYRAGKGKTQTFVRLKWNAAGMAFASIGALHALPGMIATARPQPLLTVWLGTALWTVAFGGFVGAAFGMWGFPWFARRWKALAIAATVASFMLIVASRQSQHWAIALLDLIFLGAISDGTMAEREPSSSFWKKLGRFAMVASLLYGMAVIALHPWYQNWGATDQEITRVMIGDEGAAVRDHHINHVVTVKAPPERVWPYLVQIGQDRAGFYSYDFLERAFGTRIHNVYEIRPEWQHRQAGDFVRSCPPDWMGGRMSALTGWRVGRVEPNRLLYLENWGPMWLQPIDGNRTRFGIRSDIGDVSLAAAPIELFLFEPIHFVMEQRMLRTIRDLAERNS